MNFKDEYELQEFIHSVTGGQREVEMPDGSRVDVLTHNAVIEVKPKLTRSALLQAMGQVIIYGSHYPNKRMVIAGCTPKDEESSYATADRVRGQGVEVWYIDQMHEFCDTPPLFDLPELQLPDLSAALFAKLTAAFIFVGMLLLFSSTEHQPARPRLTPIFDDNGYLIDRIPSESTVKAIGCSGNFVQIRYGQNREKIGWVSHIEFDEDVCPQPHPTPTAIIKSLSDE